VWLGTSIVAFAVPDSTGSVEHLDVPSHVTGLPDADMAAKKPIQLS
jgi:hypothetical protein